MGMSTNSQVSQRHYKLSCLLLKIGISESHSGAVSKWIVPGGHV